MEPAPDKPYSPGDYVPPDLNIVLRPIAVSPLLLRSRWQYVQGLFWLVVGTVGLLVLGLSLLYLFSPHYVSPSYWETAHVTMGEVVKGLNQYKTETGVYPATLDELRRKSTFINGVPKDPFSKDNFLYERTAGGFTLICLGKDQAPGGAEPPEKDIIFNESGEVR